jgi:proteasome lid subunit RPN8/RPN11
VEEGATMTSIVVVARDIVRTTIEELQHAGRVHQERVVLWLGRREANVVTVQRVFVPIQEAAHDYFHIPREGMAALLTDLRQSRLQVAAQVHSHPHEAFHSQADDRWAIIRHVGALSLVVPSFGLQTTIETFVDDAAVYELLPDNQWHHVPVTRVLRCY